MNVTRKLVKAEDLKQIQQNSVMETRDHFKNGASPKSHTNRKNFKNSTKMKRQMFYLAAVVMMLTMVINACEKNDSSSSSSNSSGSDTTNNGNSSDEDGNSFVINATNVVNSNSNIATAKAFVEAVGDDYEVASAEYKNSGFKMNLPASVPDKRLTSAYNWFSGEVIYEALEKLSDKNAKITYFDCIYAYDEDGIEIGTLRQKQDYYDDVDLEELYYIYADRNFTIKGTFSDCEVNCTFKKGWNVFYVYADEDDWYVITTSKPSSINLKWYFSER